MILRNSRVRPEPYRQAAQALGLEPGAGEDEVKKAYRRTAQKFHPDQHASEGRDAVYASRFHLATTAKNLLLARGGNDEAKALADFTKARTDYDKALKDAGITPRPAAAKPAAAKPAAAEPKPASGATRGRAWKAGSAEAHQWKPGGFGGTQAGAGSASWRKWEPQEFPRDAKPKPAQGSTWSRGDFKSTASQTAASAPGAARAGAPEAESVRPAPRRTETVAAAASTPAAPQRPDPRAQAAVAAYTDTGAAPTGRRLDLYA